MQSFDMFYKIENEGEPILFLHGWGMDSTSFLQVKNAIKCKSIVVDFSPFGQSKEPNEPLTLWDYANKTKQILDQNNIDKFSIICHSFGFRVAILLCEICKGRVQKIVATGGAGIRKKISIKRFFNKLKFKTKKLFNKNAVVGSEDYKNLSGVMKKTFSNIVQFDLRDYAKKIDIPVLLVYGTKDKQTPKNVYKTFSKTIKNSKLVLYKNKTHFAYLENLQQFVLDCKIFLKGG